MNEKELKELERLARTAIEHNPQESGDLLEQAILERKDELWQTIQKKARRRVRMRKVRPWIAAAAVVMMAVLVSGAVGFNQARAGKDGLLVDIVEGVSGGLTFSDEPVEFKPIIMNDVSWDEITSNIDPVIEPLLPKELPSGYEFIEGTYLQHENNMIDMILEYRLDNNNIKIWYKYRDVDTGNVTANIGLDDSFVLVKWDGISVYYSEAEEESNIVWEQNNCVISIRGRIKETNLRELYNSIREP